MAAQLGSPFLLIAVWLLGGVISIFGAMAFAELGTMFPETGGQYVYLRKAYGDFTGYLYGWASIAVINTAAIAAIAFVCAEYADNFLHVPRFDTHTENSIALHIPMIGNILPLQNFGVKTLAISIIMILTLLNYVSVRLGNAVQFLSTLLKAVVLIILVFGILFSGKGNSHNFITDPRNFNLSGWLLAAAFMAATTGAFASYDGWNNLNMVAGEIKDPTKNITKSLLIGVTACILIYVLITLAYIYVLPIHEMAKSPLVASDATAKVYGAAGGAMIAALIVLSTFGATSVNLLANARVVFAMAEAKSFFRWAGKVHPRFLTPGNSVLVLGIWSSLFVITGSFDILADMFIFVSWIFYGLVVLGLFILRRKMPKVDRPYKVQGYPIVPGIFVLFTVFYLVAAVYNDISNYASGKSPFILSIVGILLTAMGIPLFFYFRARGKN